MEWVNSHSALGRARRIDSSNGRITSQHYKYIQANLRGWGAATKPDKNVSQTHGHNENYALFKHNVTRKMSGKNSNSQSKNDFIKIRYAISIK